LKIRNFKARCTSKTRLAQKLSLVDMVSNREIRRLFALYAELLLLHQRNEKLAKLLSGAGYRIGKLPTEVTQLTKAEVSNSFRPEIVAILDEAKKTGTIEALDELIQLTPTGLFEMMRIKGLGGKKLAVLWKLGHIDTIEALLDACKKHLITGLPGFGKRTQDNIIAAIESYRDHLDRFHFASVADAAAELIQSLNRLFKKNQLSLCGDVRRQSTTVESIEIITDIPAKNFNDKSLRRVLMIESSNKSESKGHTLDEIPVRIYHVKDQFAFQLFKRTGNESHVKRVISKTSGKINYRSEEEIYKKVGLPFIVPEMREDLAEWDFANDIGELIATQDIRGVVHNHTRWSDGVDSLIDFVTACKKRKYEYVVISDHSKNAHYAGGLKEEKVLRQMKEIDGLNKRMAPFRIFKSIECDILVSGELDYPDDLLQLFDLVIVSIHQLLRMDEERATKRLIKAIENPYTTILGHMTGRQLLIRPGYAVNFKKVIDACAANNVVIELNANPYRLDMDWSHIPYAMSKGVLISINPDAHSIFEIDNIRWGVSAARKGGLTRAMTWNAMPLKGVESWLREKKRSFKRRSASAVKL
jgi:DNA polymerase (family 10)